MESKKVSKKLNILGFKSIVPILLLFYLLMILIFSLINPIFISFGNIRSIILNLGIPGIVAIGLSFVVLTGNIDLSVGSIFVFSAVVTGTLIGQNVGMPIPLGIIIGVIVGACIGAINGFFVTIVGVNSIITTLGTLAIFRGLSQIIGKFAYRSRINNEVLLYMGRGYLFDYVPITFVYMIILLIVFYLVLRFTKFGKDIHSTGANEMVARLYGVATRRVKFLAFVISGIFSAIAGILLMSQLARATYDAGVGLEFEVLTIVILGGISLLGGRGTLMGVLVAIFIVGSISNGLAVIDIPLNARNALTGIILIGAIIFDSIRNRNFYKFEK